MRPQSINNRVVATKYGDIVVIGIAVCDYGQSFVTRGIWDTINKRQQVHCFWV